MCPICERASRDGLPCKQCWARVRQRLNALPGLWLDLQVTRQRRDRLAPPTEGRSDNQALPWNEQAAQVAQRVQDGVDGRRGIRAWAALTATLCHDTMPTRVAGMARMLHHHTAALRLHAEAAEFAADVWGWTAAILAVIDLPEARRIPVGDCPELFEDAPCPGKVEAILPADTSVPGWARCTGKPGTVCGAVWDAAQWRRLGARIAQRQAAVKAQAALAKQIGAAA